MDSKRIAVFAGIIGVLSAVVKTAPRVLLGTLNLFEQGAPGWLPTVGTLGQTVLLYIYGTEIVGALLLVVLTVGFGYYVGQQLDLSDEYRQFFGAVVAGTTVPLLVAWGVGVGAFLLGISSGFDVVMVTALLLRLFATISLPVIVGGFAGAALTHFSTTEDTPLEPDEATTDTTSTTS
jgi:membrane protein DedA with SNARE-associated domain